MKLLREEIYFWMDSVVLDYILLSYPEVDGSGGVHIKSLEDMVSIAGGS